jgi:hypothetical protein
VVGCEQHASLPSVRREIVPNRGAAVNPNPCPAEQVRSGGEVGLEFFGRRGIIPLTFRVNDLNSGWVWCPHFPALSGSRYKLRSQLRLSTRPSQSCTRSASGVSVTCYLRQIGRQTGGKSSRIAIVRHRGGTVSPRNLFSGRTISPV